MADNPPPSSHLTINPPPLSSSTSAPGFTPRSSSFPDNIDSDEEDVFEPTPMHSPSGPHYDDLPPSYDEAQQQALRDARNGIPPLNPNELEVAHLNLDAPQYEIPAGAEVHAHRATADELARERRNGNRGEVNIPTQHVQSSENIPVGRVGSATSTARPTDQASVLLTTALQFTKHDPDADVRYAPRLTRCIAIPQDTAPPGRKGKTRCGSRRGGRGRGDAHVPGAWPGASSETLSPAVEEPAQFLRAYAKALHAHSIRPAEFLDFLDGLNALCAATKCTPADIVRAETSTDPDVEIVRNYVNATNEAFFAPRGLKISLRSFASLLDTIRIPEERGRRASAVASVLDTSSTPAKKSQALRPWIETLETNVSELSISALTLREMGERFRNAPRTTTTNETPQAPENEKTRLEREYAERDRAAAVAAADNEDPPHSIPGEFPHTNYPPTPPFGIWRGRGRGGPWTPFRSQEHIPPGHGPHGPPGFTPFGPPGHGPFGPPGFTQFGPPGHGPHGPPGFTPFGPPGFGPFGPPGRGPWARGGAGASGNGAGWQTLGQSLGKWGEDLGKKMEAWGDQFAKEASEWGNDASRRAETLRQRPAGPSTQPAPPLAPTNTSAQDGQESGVHRPVHSAVELQNHAEKKAARKHAADDDNSSLSSDSDSDSDSGSDSDADSDDENDEKAYTAASTTFASRLHEINTAADASRAKGKKSPSDIERDRALAIEKAAQDKSAMEEKIEQKRTKRAVMRDFRTQRRDLNRQHREKRRELRRQGLGKKSREWKEAKKGHRERKKALRLERGDVRRQFREAWKGERSERRGKGAVGTERDAGESVWVVVENLGEGRKSIATM